MLIGWARRSLPGLESPGQACSLREGQRQLVCCHVQRRELQTLPNPRHFLPRREHALLSRTHLCFNGSSSFPSSTGSCNRQAVKGRLQDFILQGSREPDAGLKQPRPRAQEAEAGACVPRGRWSHREAQVGRGGLVHHLASQLRFCKFLCLAQPALLPVWDQSLACRDWNCVTYDLDPSQGSFGSPSTIAS